jgi:hydroxypyruvate isomerase
MANEQQLNRRGFIAGATVGTAAVSGLAAGSVNQAGEKFKMHFAPHPGMFKASAGKDVLDQIRFAHDTGFTAWEQNGMPNETPEMQEKIGKLLDDLGMAMGVFVAFADFETPKFAVRKEEWRAEVVKKMKEAIDIAKRCNASFCTVVPGSVDQQSAASGQKWNKYGGPRLAEGYQLANVIDLLRECAEILEPQKLTMVLEPLNWHANHGGTFLVQSDQAYAICRAVNSSSCKILFDIYHQQITEGNLIPNIDMCWDEIGYFQSGDNPGRKEPGTGEIHYKNVFQHIYSKSKATGRNFIVGMEHGNSMKGKDGEQAVIDAYRAVNPTEG